MSNFLDYIFREVKNERLTRSTALDLIRLRQRESLTDQPVLLHPLLHQNTSNFYEQRFSSTFTGREFFAAERIVDGRRVLPEVAQLEMARAAVHLATATLPTDATGRTPEDGSKGGLKFKNIIWGTPIAIENEPVRVHIGLFPENNGEIVYRIFSDPEQAGMEPIIHSQGTVEVDFTPEIPFLDLANIQAQCRQNGPGPDQFYETIRKMGVDYGPGYRSYQMAQVGAGYLLAKLSLPGSVSSTEQQLGLHPSILDSVLQVAAGLDMNSGEMTLSRNNDSGGIMAPFVLQEVELFEKCSSCMWALIHFSEENQDHDLPPQVEIELADEQGTICVRMKCLAAGLEGTIQAAQVEQEFPPTISSVMEYIQERALALPQLDPMIERIKIEGKEHIKAFDPMLCKLLWVQLQSMGLFEEEQLPFSKLEAQIHPPCRKWFKESLNVLARYNYLTYDGDSVRLTGSAPVDSAAIWNEWNQKKIAWSENPNVKAQTRVVEAVIQAMPEILSGKKLATEVLFPNSSMELMEGIYKNNVVADYYNDTLTGNIVAYIEGRLKEDPSARIRMLEIGAGTGGTSTMVFQKIRPYQNNIQEYCYTDLSKAFLLHAERTFGPQNPYLTYHIFNAEAPFDGQGLGAGEYDLIIAANVLHATKNIRQTLRNSKVALRKNGVLFLNEISNYSLFFQVIFGLLEGWWLYEDPELRIPGCPGLSPETWQMVLESEGFRSVFFPGKLAHDLGQQIIIAESDGVVCRKPTLKPFVTSLKDDSQAARSQNIPKAPAPAQEPELPKMKTITAADVTDQMVNDYVKEIIIEKLSEALKLDIQVIDVTKPFSDYGLDSILGVNLVQNLNQILKTELQTISLYDYNTVNKLTAYVVTQSKDVIAKILGQKGKPMDAKPQNPPSDVTLHHQERRPAPLGSNRFSRREAPPESSPKNAIQKEPIAIIGMSGRFAKSSNVNELWEHLSNGADLVEEVSRWDLSQYYPDGTNYCSYGSFLEDIDKFDPFFFKISGLEATYMDPKQRIFLEESWKALEDAGYTGTGIAEQLCGIYVGCGGGDYHNLFGENIPAQSLWGNMESVVPARIAYHLNLQGPAIAIDTACSSSLVAIHLACQGLWTREINMALAGGVALNCTPSAYIVTNRAGMLSPVGRCYTFDERADGFIPGEGVGAVVLKRLNEAIADRDHIYGVIRGSGINQDGTTNGITAPSVNSQERLECHVYDSFQIDPAQIQMVEAHGTGTKLGDPIEFEALSRAFRKYTDKKEYCAIGSIKTNLGHATLAAGVAGIIKILLSLKHQQIPPTLHFQRGNPNIQFTGSPFYVNTKLAEWEVESGVKRCAVISSFGASGTNAHLAIEEAPTVERRHSEKPGYLIVLSARTSEQLQQQVTQLAKYCHEESRMDCGNVSFTLLMGRKHFNHRLACIVRNQNELTTFLEKWLEKGQISQVYVSELNETNHREQPALQQYGNECIQKCQDTNQVSEYLDYLAVVADLYVQGYTLDYGGLFAHDQYSRVSLPTYPFARESYWVSGSPPNSSAIPEKRSAVQVLPAQQQDLERHHSSDATAYVAKLLRELLKLPLHYELDFKTQLSEYGMDSILGVQLLEKIKQELGIELNPKRFFAEFTMEAVIDQIKETSAPSTAPTTEPISVPWEMDRKLPERIVLKKNIIPFKHNSLPSKVFLTGITGLVGAFLGHEILEKTSATLYCLVRANSEPLALQRIQDNFMKFSLWNPDYQSRIIPVPGDITKPGLGMKKEQYRELSREIDTIYHCAAVANHLLNYLALKEPNVNGSLSIIEFAANLRVKPIHFISSSIVCFRMDGDKVIPAHQSETIVDDAGKLASGYAQTKWVSEHHLLQAQKKGIPVTIFRCSEITGSSQTGSGIVQDMFHSFLSVFHKVGVIPRWEQGVMEIAPVDYVSRAIVTTTQQKDCYGKIYHLTPLQPIPVQKFFDFLQTKNPVLPKVLFEEWADCCLSYVSMLPEENSIRNILLSLFMKSKSGRRPFELYFYNLGLENTNIKKALQNTGNEFPDFGDQWWENCLKRIALFDCETRVN